MMVVLTMAQLISMTSSYTHRPVFADHHVCERFAVIAPQEIDPSEAKALLFSALESHAHTIVPTVEGNKIRTIRHPSELHGACKQMAPEMVTLLLRRPNSMAFNDEEKKIKKLLSKDGHVELIWGSSSIVVSDVKENIEKIQKAF